MLYVRKKKNYVVPTAALKLKSESSLGRQVESCPCNPTTSNGGGFERGNRLLARVELNMCDARNHLCHSFAEETTANQLRQGIKAFLH
jgi:hypothetical protein